MAPCKVLARVGDSGALVVEALPAWVESMRSRAFWLDPTTWSASTIVRAMKYCAFNAHHAKRPPAAPPTATLTTPNPTARPTTQNLQT
jgi:hypothetical protein